MYKLIIVDDDELIRKGLAQVIPWKEIGYQVMGVFSNGKEALQFLENQGVDVIFTDIKMPEMTGLELIEKAALHCPDIRSVIISGYSEFELAKKAISLKTEDYLLKPLGQDDIESVFLKLKHSLDAQMTKGTTISDQKMDWEYELMKRLDSQLHVEQPFEKRGRGNSYFELVILKILPDGSKEGAKNDWTEYRKRIKTVFQDQFYCNTDMAAAVLVLPECLNGILMQLKKEFFNLSGCQYQLLIGKEVYSEMEVISSYWSAVERMKQNRNHGVIHYQRERNLYKKEWDYIQGLKDKIIESLEDGRYFELDGIAESIHGILEHYDNKVIYNFYYNIILKIVKYFESDAGHLIYSQHQFAEVDLLSSTPEQSLADFKQDIDSIRQSLKENSDSMRNIISNKAKAMIERDYADGGLSLASLANRLGVSYGYLSTIFAKSTGKSFKTYLVDIRMEKARILLLSRKYKIYEISGLVGYHNSRYFTDAFRKYYNCSPVEYLSRFRGAYEKE